MKINNFWGDLTDISAKKEALLQTLSLRCSSSSSDVVLPMLFCCVLFQLVVLATLSVLCCLDVFDIYN